MKKCLVNLITGNNRVYIQGQKRLVERMRGQDIPLLYFNNVGAVGAPPHEKVPFAFKLYAIQQALKLGYRQIFWVDASVYPVHNIEPIFERLDKCGIFLEDSGHQCDRWLRQESLDYFSITREQAKEIDMISAGFIGFDFDRSISESFFTRWWLAMEAGMFAGSTVDYRSEQGAASVIAYQMGLSGVISKPHTYFCYVGAQYGEPNPEAPFHLQGF